MELRIYLNEKQKRIEQALRDYLPKAAGPVSELVESMRYSLFAGGKRLRPVLCVAGAEAVGGPGEDVLPVACALEFIHTYSLIHDDLPAMDDDDLRRGKPTNHKVFGDAMALLAGDGLLTEAFSLLCSEQVRRRFPADVVLSVVRMIATAAGYQGMVGGQAVDIRSEGRDVGLETVEFIHARKTGALITASVVAGALLGGGDRDQTEAIERYGRHVGLAFQIADDILDVVGDSRLMGKQAGSDDRKKKATFPAAVGLHRAGEVQARLVQTALQAVADFDHRADPLRGIASYIVERKR